MITRFIESLGLDPEVFDARSEVKAGNAPDAEGLNQKSGVSDSMDLAADGNQPKKKHISPYASF